MPVVNSGRTHLQSQLPVVALMLESQPNLQLISPIRPVCIAETVFKFARLVH